MNTTYMRTIIAGVVGAAMTVPFGAGANLVIDGGFEGYGSGIYTEYTASANIGAWQVTAGSVDVVTASYWQPASGNDSTDMAGLSNGTIEQTIATTPGASYYLSFNMAGNPDGPPTLKTLRVYFGSAYNDFSFDITGKSRSNMGWVLQSCDFTATGTSTILEFQDTSAPAGTQQFPNTTPWGAVIDNVSLVAVPEPTTMIAGALLLLPFGVSTLRALRRRTA
jgi:choice-of-anchor C domain-containing protein